MIPGAVLFAGAAAPQLRRQRGRAAGRVVERAGVDRVRVHDRVVRRLHVGVAVPRAAPAGDRDRAGDRARPGARRGRARPRLGRHDRPRRRPDRRRRHLRHRRRLPPAGRGSPASTYAILEARDAIGGTWDLFRYPGHPLGLRPAHVRLRVQAVDATTRRSPTAPRSSTTSARPPREHGIDRHIRFGHRVVRAAWSTRDARWTVDVERRRRDRRAHRRLAVLRRPATTATTRATRRDFPGLERFAGQVVHPQHWPEDLDYAGKRVVVIGSGATAVTLVPAMAETAAHVTMLQRSPTYVLPLPAQDPIANAARAGCSAHERAYGSRAARTSRSSAPSTGSASRFPSAVRKLIRRVNAQQLPDGYPRRRALQPALRPVGPAPVRRARRRPLQGASARATASIVTDHIATFTEHGILLASGARARRRHHRHRDRPEPAGVRRHRAVVDGEPVALPDTLAYKGMMLSGVPNFAFAIGYTNSSWTLKVDLVCEYLCRLLAHMDAHGDDAVRPPNRPGDCRRGRCSTSAGYVQRAIDQFPRQGERGAVAARDELRRRRQEPAQRPGRRRDAALLLRDPAPTAVAA